MSGKNKLMISTRKGLISYVKDRNNKWTFSKVDFLGLPVSMAYVDYENSTWWACLDHGHWGSKLHRSGDEGKTWQEVDAPQFPEGEEIKDGVPASLKYMWAMAGFHNKRSNGLFIGTEPGGLFRSNNNGNHLN